jgi:hypothetical protein
VNGEPDLRQLVQQAEAEFVCLRCTLPECNEGAPGCLYQQARAEEQEATPPEPEPRRRYAERERRAGYRLRRKQDKRCPVCGTAITDKASACRKHVRRLER